MSLLLASLLTLGHTGLGFKEIKDSPQPKPTLLVVGDSYTLRTGICEFFDENNVKLPGTFTYEECATGKVEGDDDNEFHGGFPYEVSYGSYLESATDNQVELIGNQGRGGDTCLWLADENYRGQSVHAGEERGLVHPDISDRINESGADIVSILIGINDVNTFYREPEELRSCLVSLYGQVAVQERLVVAMTYPPIPILLMVGDDLDGDGLPDPLPSAWPSNKMAGWNVPLINNAIRSAVQTHNVAHPDRPVLLAETSDAWDIGQSYTFTSDGAHPKEFGAMWLASRWVQHVCFSAGLSCGIPKRD